MRCRVYVYTQLFLIELVRSCREVEQFYAQLLLMGAYFAQMTIAISDILTQYTIATNNLSFSFVHFEILLHARHQDKGQQYELYAMQCMK